MTITELKKEYEVLMKSKDPFDTLFDFKDSLLSSDADDFLSFHFEMLKNRKNESLYLILRSFFDEREGKDTVSDFLFSKYQEGIDDVILKADVIQILGHLRSRFAREVALENMKADQRDLRYRSIIVLGWVGNVRDLAALHQRMISDKEPQLRGYAATAMRQVWFNYPKAKDDILKYLKDAMDQEKDEKALAGMIITAQEILRKKLGLKESKYGDVSGDVSIATAKTIDALKKIKYNK